jgi:hypothetical protein
MACCLPSTSWVGGGRGGGGGNPVSGGGGEEEEGATPGGGETHGLDNERGEVRVWKRENGLRKGKR